MTNLAKLAKWKQGSQEGHKVVQGGKPASTNIIAPNP